MAISTHIQEMHVASKVLDNYLIAGNSCNQFLFTYNRPFHKKIDLSNAQLIASIAFKSIFTFLTDCSLENCKRVYRSAFSVKDFDPDDGLPQDGFHRSLVSLIETKITRCDELIRTFQEGIVKLLKTVPGNLLSNRSMIGFQISGGSYIIGECNCCDLMERGPRHSFSESLVYEIKEHFPEKQTITIASIGAGGCFHELTIHALLAEEGCKAKWLIVDPANSESTISHFNRIANWITPDTTVEGIKKSANAFFTGLKSKNEGLPEVCLFIDVNLFITDRQIEAFGSEIKHDCLFATYSNQGEIEGDFARYPKSKP